MLLKPQLTKQLSEPTYHCMINSRLVRVPQESLGTHTLEQLPVAKGTDENPGFLGGISRSQFMRLGRHLVARVLH